MGQNEQFKFDGSSRNIMQGLQALKDLCVTKPVKISWQLLRPIFVNIKSIPSLSHQCPILTFWSGTEWTIQICSIKQECFYTAAGFPNIED